MKNMSTHLLAISLFILSGCSTIVSSYHYTTGTQHLDCGNYHEAISELEQAVELDPTMARNHTNLSYAYSKINNEEKAWYHNRQATRCPYSDGLCVLQFRLYYYQKMIVDKGFDKPGTPWEEISNNLGEPDEYQVNENGEIISCYYGICKMTFSNGLLTSCDI